MKSCFNKIVVGDVLECYCSPLNHGLTSNGHHTEFFEVLDKDEGCGRPVVNSHYSMCAIAVNMIWIKRIIKRR